VIPDVEIAKPVLDAVHVMPVWRDTQVNVPLDVEVPYARRPVFTPALDRHACPWHVV